MIGAVSHESDSADSCSIDRPGVYIAVNKPRFPLNLYIKERKEQEARLIELKLEQDSRLTELKQDIESKQLELVETNNQVHRLEERIRKRKKRVAELCVDENELPQKAPRVVRPSVTSELSQLSSDKLKLSVAQIRRRKKSTLAALRPIHCSGDAARNNQKPVVDGLWTTLIGSTTKRELTGYISNSDICQSHVIPEIVSGKITEYEKSESNKVRSIRTLYEGGLLSKTAYTSKRNCTDITKDDLTRNNAKTEFMPQCEIPKVLPYKKLMSVVNGINIGEVRDLETLAVKWSLPSVSGVYRPLQPFLLKLADFYLALHEKKPCLHWFNGEVGVFRVAMGADGAPFGKDNTATAYLVSVLNLLHRVQSCNDNHLILGASGEEDCPLLKKYTDHLRQEMEAIEGEKLTTVQGNEVVFYFDLIPSDMKWVSSMAGELNNAATYFSPFANVSQKNKGTVNGSIGGEEATWQPWKYSERISVANKVEKYKKTLSDPKGKHRNKVTKYISDNHSRQEFVPPLGKYVDKVMAEPLHNMNNAWQSWFTLLLTLALYSSNQAFINSSDFIAALPNSFPLIRMLDCIKNTVKCGRLYKSYCRWFNEKRKAKVPFLYRFTSPRDLLGILLP